VPRPAPLNSSSLRRPLAPPLPVGSTRLPPPPFGRSPPSPLEEERPPGWHHLPVEETPPVPRPAPGLLSLRVGSEAPVGRVIDDDEGGRGRHLKGGHARTHEWQTTRIFLNMGGGKTCAAARVPSNQRSLAWLWLLVGGAEEWDDELRERVIHRRSARAACVRVNQPQESSVLRCSPSRRRGTLRE